MLNEPVRPYLSLAAEAIDFDDGAGGKLDTVAPRVGLGLKADTGGGGTLGFDITSGEVFDGARSTSASLTYALSF